MFESTPLYPTHSRYWQLIEKYKITQFYTAPTAIRALQKYGDEGVKGYDLSSLRVLGSVGEPINPSAWEWYYQSVGKGKCAIVDTYWQTETGTLMHPSFILINPILFSLSLLSFDHLSSSLSSFSLGGIIMTPLPGVTDLKPGSCTLPFFGIKPVLLNGIFYLLLFLFSPSSPPSPHHLLIIRINR